MKLKQACEIAKSCELCTVGEAVFNIKLHRDWLFTPYEVLEELRELDEDRKGISDDTKIDDILNLDEEYVREILRSDLGPWV